MVFGIQMLQYNIVNRTMYNPLGAKSDNEIPIPST